LPLWRTRHLRHVGEAAAGQPIITATSTGSRQGFTIEHLRRVRGGGDDNNNDQAMNSIRHIKAG
jgi:hypothetical protein